MIADQSLPYSRLADIKGSLLQIGYRPCERRTDSTRESDKLPKAAKWSPSCSVAGFLLMNSSLSPISFNTEAVAILGYPNKLTDPARSELFNTKIRSALLSKGSRDVPFVSEFKSGRRRYFCRAFLVDTKQLSGAAIAVLLERGPSGLIPLSQLSQQYHLTQREAETLVYLLQGLSSKEIASRMNVSTNTVKTFLRLVMIKTNVSSRSAMIGKIMMTQA